MINNLSFFLITDGNNYVNKSSYVVSAFTNKCIYQNIGTAKTALTRSINWLNSSYLSEENKNSNFEKLIAMKIYKISINLNEGSVDMKAVFSATMSNGLSNLK
jgi:hypothetical protein